MNRKIDFLKGRVKITSSPVIVKRKKITKAKRKHRSKIVKAKRRNVSISKDYKTGQSIGDLATALWKLQSNPQPVYVHGHRVHHGTVGLAMMLGGALLKSDAVMGFGEALARDDKDDASEWFKFEREPSYITGYA